ncbi:PREDICTED: gibberellin 2-beta-dioxygenase-like [Erythranthe guttata]|nr:PREDICTED: gibberellin 2-beta-dioxygenase-like [Erythranthe guttata]|eukprot:XP_012830243.1 PREDICTED: gibberellin 2-beta-dioxygenase-like [Erythranthe guttata]
MVVLSQPVLDNFAHFETCKPTGEINIIPAVDLSDYSNAKKLILEACKEFGFFKVTNHGVSMEFLDRLESEVVEFFKLPQQEKEKSGPPSPFGYGNKKIGPNGDVGWVEYLLLSTDSKSICPGISDTLWCLVNEYVCAVRKMVCEVLEMIAEELKIGSNNKDVLSKLIKNEKSDSCFRVNHYPPCPDNNHHQILQPLLMNGQDLIGFGEHTDPQIISVVKSNNTSGLQICLKDGTWVAVPPDPTSFFFIVGDSLQVMTNGRFRSVKHRVLAGDSVKSRVSMIYFGGPPLSEKITPLPSILEEGEVSLYKEFTWSEYKNAAGGDKVG